MGNKGVLFWIIFGLSVLTILCGILIICDPALYWSFMNIVLGFLLILLGIFAIANSIRHMGAGGTSGLLAIIGFFLIIIGTLIMFSTDHCANTGLDDLGEDVSNNCNSGGFLGTLIMWLFGLWALVRGGMLMFFGINGQSGQKYRFLEILFGIILFALGIFTFINSDLGSRIAGVAMGISILLDGFALCFLSIRVLTSENVQVEILAAASETEISQSNINISQINAQDSMTNQTQSQPNTTVNQTTIPQTTSAEPTPTSNNTINLDSISSDNNQS